MPSPTSLLLRPRSWLVLVPALLAAPLVGASCGDETEAPRVARVEPEDLAAVLGGSITLSGSGLAGLAGAELALGPDRAPLQELTASADGRSATARVPAGLEPGTRDLVLHAADGATTTVARALRLVAGELQIEVSNIGQGDAGFIRAPGGRTLVIDGGRAREAGRATALDSIAPVLVARGIRRPEFVLVTHFDADHLGGVVDWLSGPDGRVCTDDDRPPLLGLLDYTGAQNTCNSETCIQYYRLRDCLAAQVASGAGWAVPEPGARIPLGGGVDVRVLAINGRVDGGVVVPTGSDNSNSIALLVQFGAFRYLTAGDLTGGPQPGCIAGQDTADVESPVAQATGPVDVLHVDHHGSCTSTNDTLVAALQPQVALVSVGENNAYGHPAQSTLDRLANAGARLYLTSPGITAAGKFEPTRLPAAAEKQHGHLRVSTADGRSFRVEVLDREGGVRASGAYSARTP